MSYVTGDPASKIRTVSSVLPAVGAASGQGGSIFVPSFDDNVNRRLIGVYSTFQTKLARLHMRIAGKDIMTVDFAVFNAANGFLACDQNYAGNVQFEYAVESVNPGGPAIILNTDDLVLRYEVIPTG